MIKLVTKEYQGNPINFKTDGFVNLTKIAKAYPNKRIDVWKQLDSTKELIEDIEKDLKLNSTSGVDYETIAIYTTRGRSAGTWAHQELAIDFARYCDVKFARWINRQIIDIIKGSSPDLQRINARASSKDVAQKPFMEAVNNWYLRNKNRKPSTEVLLKLIKL